MKVIEYINVMCTIVVIRYNKLEKSPAGKFGNRYKRKRNSIFLFSNFFPINHLNATVLVVDSRQVWQNSPSPSVIVFSCMERRTVQFCSMRIRVAIAF